MIYGTVSYPEVANLTGIDYVTGTSDALNVELLLDMMLAADPDIQTVGLLYSTSEVNSAPAIEDAKAYLDEKASPIWRRRAPPPTRSLPPSTPCWARWTRCSPPPTTPSRPPSWPSPPSWLRRASPTTPGPTPSCATALLHALSQSHRSGHPDRRFGPGGPPDRRVPRVCHRVRRHYHRKHRHRRHAGPGLFPVPGHGLPGGGGPDHPGLIGILKSRLYPSPAGGG